MSQERLSLRKIREVLRLHHEAGLSNRAVARACKNSNSTVGEYLARADQAGIGWPLPEGIRDEGRGAVPALVPGEGQRGSGRTANVEKRAISSRGADIH